MDEFFDSLLEWLELNSQTGPRYEIREARERAEELFRKAVLEIITQDKAKAQP